MSCARLPAYACAPRCVRTCVWYHSLVLSSVWLWLWGPLHCSVPFGVLFRDDKCANLFEALMGTLRAAKRRKVIDYEGEMLFQGVHDDVAVSLVG